MRRRLGLSLLPLRCLGRYFQTGTRPGGFIFLEALRAPGCEFTLDIRITPKSWAPASEFRLPCVQLNFWAPPPS